MLNRSIGEKIFSVFNGLFLTFLICVTVYPVIHVLFASISDPAELMKHQGLLLGSRGFSIKAYKSVFENPSIVTGYRNTLFYLALGLMINMSFTILGAYVLSRHKLFFKNAIMFIVVFTMFFNGGLIPLYLLIRDIHINNTFWAVIIPPAINTWNLIIMRTSFMAVPRSMEESAKIDGANDFVILLNVVIPLSLPVLIVILLFYGVERWNAWFYAMIFLRERELYPLQLILREIVINSSVDSMTTGAGNTDRVPIGETIKYAAIMVATLPIVLVYPFLQKYFVKGRNDWSPQRLSAIKGRCENITLLSGKKMCYA